MAKKQRADSLEENVSPAQSGATKRRGRTRRSQGSKEQRGQAESAEKGPPASPGEGAVIGLLDVEEGKRGLNKFLMECLDQSVTLKHKLNIFYNL